MAEKNTKRRLAGAENVTPIRLVEFGDSRREEGSVILKRAKKEHLDEVMVIGRSDDGELWAASSLNSGQSLWLIEKLRERILAGSPWSII